MSNRSWLTIALLIGLFAAATLLLDSSPEVFEAESPAQVEGEPQLTGYITGVESLQYSADGTMKYQFTAPRMSHFQHDPTEPSAEDFTTIETPHFVFFQPDSRPWYTQAQEGRSLQDGQLLVLRDGVRVWQQNPGAEPTVITTEELLIRPDLQVAETDQFVMITRPQVRSQGIGMRADLDQETFSIRSQGSSIYDPNPQPAD